VNRVAILDPNTSFTDPATGATAMNPVVTVKGVTPDPDAGPSFPNAVREWCINSAAVDAINHCAVINSEDGNVYRWDLTKATDEPGQLSPAVYLAPATGESYTPTVIGPDGAVYAINNATLCSVQAVPMVQPVIDNANHLLRYTYLRADSNSTYSVQTTTDLVNWTTSGVDQGHGGVGQYITVAVTLGAELERFVKLVITTP
jgi:hypothetical protein